MRNTILETLLIGAITELMDVTGVRSILNTPSTSVNVTRTSSSTTDKVSPFTKAEVGEIAKAMGKEFNLRMSPQGNPIITHRKTNGNNVIFSIYKREGGYIIRRRLGYDNPFGSGNVLNGGKTFPTIARMMEYFNSYVETHPNSIIG